MLLLLFSKFSFPFFISNLYQTDVTLKFAALSMGIDQNDQDEKQLQDYNIKGEGRHEKKTNHSSSIVPYFSSIFSFENRLE